MTDNIIPNFTTVQVKQHDNGVVDLILNRPEKRNALCATMIAELTSFAQTIGQLPETRAVVLSGMGNVFCAGADLGWMRDQINADRATRIFEATKLATMLNTLNTMPSPLIGKIQGGAYGGGIGLVSICDVAIADKDTKFGFTETRLGLTPATISPYVLARMGEGNARKVFMSARLFKAPEAEKLGLLARVVYDNRIENAITKEIEPYLCTAPHAVGTSKALVRYLGSPITQDIINHSIETLADIWETPEAKEGIQCFLNKQKPSWTQ